MATNLELKVRCGAADLERVADRATWAGAHWLPAMRQVDTYFHTQSGRLKLREITEDDVTPSFELIGYRRADESGARWSTYSRAAFDERTGRVVQDALTTTLGVLVVVDKARLVALWRRTRIHLDTVAGLGAFVELETVTESVDDLHAEDEIAEIAELLDLGEFPSIAGSYSDLMLAGGD